MIATSDVALLSSASQVTNVSQQIGVLSRRSVRSAYPAGVVGLSIQYKAPVTETQQCYKG